MGVLVQVAVGPHLGQVRRHPVRQRPAGPAGGDQPVGQRRGRAVLQLGPQAAAAASTHGDRVLDLGEGAVEVEEHRVDRAPMRVGRGVGVGGGASAGAGRRTGTASGGSGLRRSARAPDDPTERSTDGPHA